MEFEARLYKIHLQESEVIMVDFSNVSIDDHLKLIQKVDDILKANNKMIYFLMDGFNAKFNMKTISTWRNIVNKYDFVEYRASIYGLDFVRRLAVKFTNLTNPHSVYGFKKKEDAEKNLIENII